MRSVLLFLALYISILMPGCGGSVQHSPSALDAQRKMFTLPADEHAAIYIYRDGFLGHKVNTEILLDGRVVGKNLGWTYLYVEVQEGKHVITSHMVGYSSIEINAEKGKIYFVHEEADTGMLETKTILQLVDTITGKAGVKKCKLVESAM